ncbi:Protein of unknown function [Gryllus bimaculatus]|nr:Protein of unknown function [Gryllus bimaculatus]
MDVEGLFIALIDAESSAVFKSADPVEGVVEEQQELPPPPLARPGAVAVGTPFALQFLISNYIADRDSTSIHKYIDTISLSGPDEMLADHWSPRDIYAEQRTVRLQRELGMQLHRDNGQSSTRIFVAP